MKFEVHCASEWRTSCHSFLELEDENIGKDKKEKFNRELKAIKQYTNREVHLEEINMVTHYTNGTADKDKIVRPVIELNSLEELLELSNKCATIIEGDSDGFYDIPSIMFYDSYIE